MRPLTLALLLTLPAALLMGCTLPGEVTKPGLYECKPTNPQFQHLAPFRYDSRTADPRVAVPGMDVVYVTTTEGRRVAIRADDPARWECNIQELDR